jgi:hypothetical protein
MAMCTAKAATIIISQVMDRNIKPACAGFFIYTVFAGAGLACQTAFRYMQHFPAWFSWN